MSKSSTTRIARKLAEKAGIPSPLQPCRDLTAQECLEIQSMQQVVNARKWELAHVKGNTAIIPDGQKLAEQMDVVFNLLNNYVIEHVQRKLRECGYPSGTKCDLNLTTGQIILIP